MLTYGPCWNFCVELPVAELQAEISFLSGALGFTVNAQDESYAMLTDPQAGLYVSMRQHPVQAVERAAEHIKLCFMVTNIEDITQRLEALSVLVHVDDSLAAGSPFEVKWCRTPAGYRIEFWDSSGIA